jgi:hypothetical protein
MVKLMMTDAEVIAAIEETQARLRKPTRAALAGPKPLAKPLTFTERLRLHRAEPEPQAAPPPPLPTKPHSHFVEAAMEANKPVALEPDDANAGADMEAARLKAYNVGKLQALNKAHAIIDNVGGKTVVASFDEITFKLGDDVVTRNSVVYQRQSDFMLRYCNRYVVVDVPNRQGGNNRERIELGKWWIKHKDRRQYRGVVFAPGIRSKVVDGHYNLWSGWGGLATEGDWGLILDHIRDVVAGGNREFAEYVVKWIAWAIQNPGRQAEVALVLIGEKGAGKGTLVRVLQKIFGRHAFQAQNSDQVIGRFNAHLGDCVLFAVDEAHWGDGKEYFKCVGKLQGMITEPTLPVEYKGVDIIQVPNCLHIVMLAEPGWVIPAGRHERRYAALKVSKARLRDRAYFRALHHQIAHGGAEAMFYDLGGLDLDGWHPRDIPEALLRSEAMQTQQMRSLPAEEAWYFGLLQTGALPKAWAGRANSAFTKDLMADARAKFPRLSYDMSERSLQLFLEDEERIGIICRKARKSSNNGWGFPPLAECRTAWEGIYGAPADPWDMSETWGGEAPAAKPLKPPASASPPPPAVAALLRPVATMPPSLVAPAPAKGGEAPVPSAAPPPRPFNRRGL